MQGAVVNCFARPARCHAQRSAPALPPASPNALHPAGPAAEQQQQQEQQQETQQLAAADTLAAQLAEQQLSPEPTPEMTPAPLEGMGGGGEAGAGLELQLYADFLRIVLEIVNSILTNALPQVGQGGHAAACGAGAQGQRQPAHLGAAGLSVRVSLCGGLGGRPRHAGPPAV